MQIKAGQMIKVLLVEDEPMWQEGIRALLSLDSRISLVGVVDNADDAEVFFEAEKPDIVLLDWKIKGPRDGLDLAYLFEPHVGPERLILVTGSPKDQIPDHPFGYVPKPKIASDLLQSIYQATACSTATSPSV